MRGQEKPAVIGVEELGRHKGFVWLVGKKIIWKYFKGDKMKIFYWLSGLCFLMGFGLVENEPFLSILAFFVSLLTYKIGDYYERTL